MNKNWVNNLSKRNETIKVRKAQTVSSATQTEEPDF